MKILEALNARSVVIPSLKEGDAASRHLVDYPVLLRQPARPHVRTKAFQGLGLAKALEGVPDDGFYQAHESQGCFSVVCYPPNKIFPENDIENGVCHRWQPIYRPNCLRNSSISIGVPSPARARSMAANNRAALRGERNK